MDHEKTISRGTAMLLIFTSAILWSFGGLLVRLSESNGFTVSCIRSLLALPVALLFCRGQKLRFSGRVWLNGLWLAATGILFSVAVTLTTAANAIVLQYSTPVYIVLANRLIYRERVRRSDIFVTIACIAGMALFFLDELSPGNMLGNLIAILSGVTNAGIFVTMNRTTEDRNAITVASCVEGFVLCLPFVFLYPPPFTLKAIGALVILGVVQRGVSLALYTRASRYCSSMDGIVIAMAEPLLTPVWVMLAFGERPGRFALIGAAAILASVFVWNTVKLRAARMGVAA